ncbi:MAG: penicillin-binding protein activator [Gammaproteobacteria bacterium]|nr:penicillin-binding protein activator [Gammaproteobacteria bacterium]
MPQNRFPTRHLPPLLLATLTALSGHALAVAPQTPDTPPPAQTLLAEPPATIALLLPASGPLAKPAAAIRDGFFAAHYHRLNKLYQPVIRLYDTGAQPASIVEVYRQAVADGADVVVGPLDKESVRALARENSLGVPTLALNYGDNEGMLPDNLVQFGLSPEDEANAVAERAVQDGRTQAAALIPKSDWGERLLKAFRTRLEQLGGRIVAVQSYDAEGTDFATPLRNLLADSDARSRKIQGNTRYRQDVDFLFMAAYPRQARQIQPQVSFNYANLPVYATSHVYSGRPDKGADSDEDGIVFCDMPWVFEGAAQPLQQAIVRLWPQSVDQFRRLYALGIDAYALTPALSHKLSGLTEPFAGQTGLLKMDAARRIHRSLTCARFVAGEPRVLAPATSPP